MVTIVLLHDVMSSQVEFRRNQRDLEDLGYKVIALDLPGHGGRPVVAGSANSLDSMALDVAGRLDESVAHLVVGHSLGAIVGLRLARLRPGLVSGVLLEDPPGMASNDASRVAAEVARAVLRARVDPHGEVTKLLMEGSSWTRDTAEDAIRSRQLVDVPAVVRFLRSHRFASSLIPLEA